MSSDVFQFWNVEREDQKRSEFCFQELIQQMESDYKHLPQTIETFIKKDVEVKLI